MRTYFMICGVLAFFVACTPTAQKPAAPVAEVNAYTQFYEAMASHCGNAYQGKLSYAPPGDDMVVDEDVLLVHFRECGDDLLKLPFHIYKADTDTWNRSRTWIITKHENGLELRHDHRKPDGSDDEVTMYGGLQYGENEAGVQIFQSIPRTEESGVFRGWRLEVEPGVRYTYGTVQGEDFDWTWRIEFDLSTPVEAPPAPWGHE